MPSVISSIQNRNISQAQEKSLSPFLSGIVTEIISSPDEFYDLPFITKSGVPAIASGEIVKRGDVFSGKITQFDNSDESVSTPFQNFEMFPYVPMGTSAVLLNQAGKNNKSVLCFPFFPPHLSLPIKVGEYVWVLKESELMYYWICRKVAYHQVDDVNYTHYPRQDIISRLVPPVSNSDILNNFNPANLSDSQPGNFFERIQESSHAKNEFTGEPVPRIKKDSPDLLLQGSNNSYIELGVDKFHKNEDPLAFTDRLSFESNENRKPGQGCVDIAILRKSRQIFSAKRDAIAKSLTKEDINVVRGTRTESSKYFEIDKTKRLLGLGYSTEEISDSDLWDASARIFLTNAKSIDDSLGISDTSILPQDLRRNGDYSSATVMSLNTRIVAEETLAIANVGSGAKITFDNAGNITISSSGNARIILKSGGDILILPGELGSIKIGSENADISPLGAHSDIQGSIATLGGDLIQDPDGLGPPGPPIFSKNVKIS